MFATLPSAGNNMGAITFARDVKQLSPLRPVNSEADKAHLLQQIEASALKNDGTNIGAALQAGVNACKAEQDAQDKANGSHLQSVVILFTDGQTNVPNKSASFAKRDNAISTAKANGINVYGVYLNQGGKTKGNYEVFNIVRNVRNMPDDPKMPRQADGTLNNLDWNYSEINSASDIVGSFSNLVHLMTDQMMTDQSDGGGAETVPVTTNVTIPGVGVSELNISVRFKAGVLPKIVVTITRPDGSPLGNTSTQNVVITKNDVFFNAKILNPDPGQWQVAVDRVGNVPVTEKIEVIPDVIISTDVAGKLNVESPDGGILRGKPVTFTSWLEQSGQSVDDNNKYALFSCTLNLINSESNDVQTIPMTLDGHGRFTAQATFNDFTGYTAYAVYQTASSDQIQFRSEAMTVGATNRPPVVKSDTIIRTFRYLPFSGSVFSQDLVRLVSDPEGGDISYSLGGGVSGGFDVALTPEGMLTVDTHKKSATDVMQIVATDDQGAQTTISFQLTAQDFTIPLIVGTVIALMILVGIGIMLRSLLAGRIEATLKLVIENSKDPRISVLAYGKPLEANLLRLRRSFSLYNICCESLTIEKTRTILTKADIDALQAVFDDNGSRLRSVTIKRKLGRDSRRFLLIDGKCAPQERVPSEQFVQSFSLKEENSKLRVTCDAVSKHTTRGKTADVNQF